MKNLSMLRTANKVKKISQNKHQMNAPKDLIRCQIDKNLRKTGQRREGKKIFKGAISLNFPKIKDLIL